MAEKEVVTSPSEQTLDVLNKEEDFLGDEPKYEQLYNLCKESLGLDHDEVINLGLKLASCYIGNYKLNHCDQLLTEIMPGVEKRGGLVEIRGREALAFCRWKQGRYEEALEIFNWQLKIVGPNVALYENMAHTYNKIGKYDEAENSLKAALELIDQGGNYKPGQKGGIYLGLANVQQSKNLIQDALQSRLKALDTYNSSYGSHPHSLCAKANMYVGQTYMRILPEFRKAEPYFREALRLFKITCADSPLTLSSLCELGDLLIALNTAESILEGHQIFKEALEMQLKLETIHISEATQSIKRLLDFPPVTASATPGGTGGKAADSLTPDKILQMYAYLKPYHPLFEKISQLIMEQKLPFDLNTLDYFLTLSNAYFLSGEAHYCVETVAKTLMVCKKLDQNDPKVKEAESHCKGIQGFYFSKIK
jgi:tetratricopeptide (TPR) repeat protein